MDNFHKPRSLRELLEVRQELEKQIGPNITAFRQENNLTQSAFGQMAGLSQGYVAHVEKGERTPSTETLRSILNVLEGAEGSTDGQEEKQHK